jgi:hypothetical protein
MRRGSGIVIYRVKWASHRSCSALARVNDRTLSNLWGKDGTLTLDAVAVVTLSPPSQTMGGRGCFKKQREGNTHAHTKARGATSTPETVKKRGYKTNKKVDQIKLSKPGCGFEKVSPKYM